jgi:hypothetical protein
LATIDFARAQRVAKSIKGDTLVATALRSVRFFPLPVLRDVA